MNDEVKLYGFMVLLFCPYIGIGFKLGERYFFKDKSFKFGFWGGTALGLFCLVTAIFSLKINTAITGTFYLDSKYHEWFFILTTLLISFYGVFIFSTLFPRLGRLRNRWAGLKASLWLWTWVNIVPMMIYNFIIAIAILIIVPFIGRGIGAGMGETSDTINRIAYGRGSDDRY